MTKNSGPCYWWTYTLQIPVYNPGCQKKSETQKQFFGGKTVEEVGYKYCPFCGKRIEPGLETNIIME